MTSATVWFRRARPAVISAGWVSHSRVEPSTSARSSVAIPVGKSPLTATRRPPTDGSNPQHRRSGTSPHPKEQPPQQRTPTQNLTTGTSYLALRRFTAAEIESPMTPGADLCPRGLSSRDNEMLRHSGGNSRAVKDGVTWKRTVPLAILVPKNQASRRV